MFVDVETRAGGGSASPGVGGGLARALNRLHEAIDGLAAVDVAGESDEELLAAAVEFERVAARLAAQQLRVLAAAHRRESYAAHGSVTMASWYRWHARLDHGEAARRVQAAVRLGHFPLLAGALAAGEVSAAHVLAVTRAAIPERAAVIAEHEDTLVRLAKAAAPRELQVALRRIADHADADGSDTPPEAGGGPDARREFSVRAMFGGLGEVHGWLDQVDTELLQTLLDALDQPDPEGTPWPGRTPAQRRADAFGRLLRLVADAGVAPTVQGVKPHLLLSVDLARLLGVAADDPLAEDLAGLLSRLFAGLDVDPDTLAALLTALRAARDTGDPGDTGSAPAPEGGYPAPADDPAGPGGMGLDFSDLLDPDPAAAAGRPRLRRTGPLDLQQARRIALDAKITAVLTFGPWRVVNVGRTMRTLPAWLRPMLEMTHRHCRGPSCDRPAAWSEAHHITAWTDHGDTDLNHTVPLCKAHHQLVTSGRWHLDYNLGDGTCTWTGPQGDTHTTRPPP